jgi:hypothetical protein
MACATSQVTVLNAVVDRLISEIPTLTESTCFLSLEAEPTIEIQSNLFVTVCPIGAGFDNSTFDGMAYDGVLENSGVIVSAWSAMRLDRNEHARAVLTDDSRGLLILKQKILKALSGIMLTDPDDGHSLLTALCQPINSNHPQRAPFGEKHVGFSLTFATPFYWDLTE